MRGGWLLVPCAGAGVVTLLAAQACGNDYTLETPSDDGGLDGTTIDGATTSDGNSPLDSASLEASTVVDGGHDAGAVAFPPPCDTTVALDAIPCNLATTPTCGTSLPGYSGAATDLIECTGGTATCVRHCTMGCITGSGATFIDTCANCPSTDADRWFCGKSVGFTDPSTQDIVFECKSGQYIGGAAVCGDNLCHPTCTRTSPPPLPGACCQSTPE